jgi:hypothetical protein
MIGMEILKCVVALAGWTMVVWLWLYVTRIPAMRAARIDAVHKVGGKGSDLDGLLPERVQWIAHNYNHLHEAPTVFYAVAAVLAIVGAGDGINATLGWAYVGLRIVHSLVQATVNRVLVRFGVFALSTFVLMALVVNAARAVF